ncbi:MAG: hypothetical protein IT209_02085 [Armatimonadetes bacterium]|nr:hypothetical protein [Armatimonadota bacterium]
MKTTCDLSTLSWTLSGWIPHLWRLARTMEVGASPGADVPAIPAQVPGSVQKALLDAGLLPDWNSGLNARACEWVENRHWIYECQLPPECLDAGKTVRLTFEGLDGTGEVLLNAKPLASFANSHLPLTLDLTPHLNSSRNVLQVVFECSPRWLGQFGYTSRMTDWKVRFNYTWDWTPRVVQIGMFAGVKLEITDGAEIEDLWYRTRGAMSPQSGTLEMTGHISAPGDHSVRVTLTQDGRTIDSVTTSLESFNSSGVAIEDAPVRLWWPSGMGPQTLYGVHTELLDGAGRVVDQRLKRVGFRDVRWQRCKGAPPAADPWICVVNGKPVFLQGVNWVPPLPNFADTPPARYKTLLEAYRDMGANVVRVWGGATLESELFYDLCDEMGLMVWQEFPLSSSGVDNYPPDDAGSIETLAQIAASYIQRRHHHPSLIIWCGGNELQNNDRTPCGVEHPMLARLGEVCRELDPTRRYLPTSSSGPRFGASAEEFGKGVHWDVHGPWKADSDLQAWRDYWKNDDALFRSETGAPGASSAEMIRLYSGECEVMPCTPDNPLWRRTSAWWIEWEQFVRETGNETASLEDYVEWSQKRQAEALSIAADACKSRFPECGGFIVWMGHDCFPCTANTSVIEFDGKFKPAAEALKAVFSRTDG